MSSALTQYNTSCEAQTDMLSLVSYSQEEIDEDELLYGDSEINVTLPDDSNNTAAKDAADMESADLDTAWLVFSSFNLIH